MNPSTLSLVCLIALLPPLFSHPIPTDPAIKIKITPKGLNLATTLLQPHFFSLKDRKFDIDLTLKDKAMTGTFEATVIPTTEIVVLDNNRTYETYTGYKDVDGDSSDDDDDKRMKRSPETGHAKAIYRDDVFLGTGQMGGLKTTLKGLGLKFVLTEGTTSYIVDTTDVTLRIRTVLGQDEGQVRLGLIAGELDGRMAVTKDGAIITLTTAETNEYFEEILQMIIKKYKSEFAKEITQFTQAIASDCLPHMVFDFRLTEHPIFKDGGVELSMVGKFIYDKDSVYKVSKIPEIDQFLSGTGLSKSFIRQGTDTPDKTDRTTIRFVLADSATSPNQDALKLRGSDATEQTRKDDAGVVLTIKEDFFNSFFQMVVESGMVDLTLSKEEVVALMAFYEGGRDNRYMSDVLPEGSTFEIKLLPTEGHKYITFTNGTYKVNLGLRLGIGGARADYTFQAETKLLFRDGSLSKDFQLVYLEKTADVGYPSILHQESLKVIFDIYTSEFEEMLTASSEFQAVAQLEMQDRYAVIGFHPSVLN